MYPEYLVLIDEVLFDKGELIVSGVGETFHIPVSDLCLVRVGYWSALHITLQYSLTTDHYRIVILSILTQLSLLIPRSVNYTSPLRK